MAISKPMLPPKKGYVERVDSAGNHYYEPTDHTKRDLAFFGNENAELSAEHLRRALQMFALTLTDDDAMEIAMVYPMWEIGVDYKVDTIVTYGKNDVGDPQLYRIVQAHTSAEEWTPDAVKSLYVPIGLTDDGYPVWSAPTGAHDAYNVGDVVSYNGVLYRSLIDGNVYSPESYPAGWEEYNK